METNVSRLGQGPGLAWKRNTSSFPPGSLAELQEWTGGKTEPVGPSWPDDLVFTQWNTIGWAITDDGVLCIKPWKGSAGETGPATFDDDVPWHDQASKIRKIESTGTISLNEDSQNLFYDCSSLTDMTGLAGWDVSNVTDMSFMFSYCSSLTDLTALKGWNVSNVTDMHIMFGGCSDLTDLTGLKDWNVSSVTDMGSMFYDCSSLTNLTPLANWNVSNVTNMESMFSGCSSLTDLTAIKNWNVSNVMEMRDMFYYCSSIQKIGIPSIANGGRKLVENAEDAYLTTVLPSIVSVYGSIGPYTWDELKSEMTTRPNAFRSGTVWVRANEEAE